MADVKISALPAAGSITGAELVPVVQGGVTKRTTASGMVPYKIYRALLSQSGTDAPVATVLESTISSVTFSYDTTGSYKIITPGGFDPNKTYISALPNLSWNGSIKQVCADVFDDSGINKIYLSTYDHNTDNKDDWNAFIPLEILVYP